MVAETGALAIRSADSFVVAPPVVYQFEGFAIAPVIELPTITSPRDDLRAGSPAAFGSIEMCEERQFVEVQPTTCVPMCCPSSVKDQRPRSTVQPIMRP